MRGALLSDTTRSAPDGAKALEAALAARGLSARQMPGDRTLVRAGVPGATSAGPLFECLAAGVSWVYACVWPGWEGTRLDSAAAAAGHAARLLGLAR